MTDLNVGRLVRDRLASLGVSAHPHPAERLPTDAGRVLPAAVVAAHAPASAYRASGRRRDAYQSATVHCVGSTRDECLWMVARVREALDGWRITAGAGTAREDSYGPVEPATTPDADPIRVEAPLIFHFPI